MDNSTLGIPKHPSNPKAIWCEHCEVWCRSESAFVHHKQGRKHLQPKMTVDIAYKRLFGYTMLNDLEQEKQWKDLIKKCLQETRIMKLDAKSSGRNNNKQKTTYNSVLTSPGTKRGATASAKVLLFYKYVYIENLDALHEWQKSLGLLLNLNGRIRIGKEGINGTVCGSKTSILLYIEAMKFHVVWKSFFNDIDFKESNNNISSNAFSNFWVRQCKEIVVMGQDPDLITAKNGGVHLNPTDFHDQIVSTFNNTDKNGDKATTAALLDVRNLYESAIGTMKGAIRLPTRHFSEFPKIADQLIKEHSLKNKNVYMYCTGGIRCERASAYLKSKGVKNCFQLKGGIHRYVEQYGKDGLFVGKNFVFDRRISSERVGDKIIGKCTVCNTASVDEYVAHFTCDECGVWILVCTICQKNILKEKEEMKNERKHETAVDATEGQNHNTTTTKLKKRKLNKLSDVNNSSDMVKKKYFCEYCLIQKGEAP